MTIREEGAQRLVNRHALYSAAAGLVPVPIFDLAAITGVQIKMLKEMADYYGIPFQADLGKSMVSALIGGVVPTKLAYGVAGSMIKGVPVIGQLLSIFTAPAFASASTYAIGRVFITHFESGGTFLDFDPEKVRQHFKAEYESAHASATATAPAPEKAAPATAAATR
jgi:uncharacterized protein (DUF697 family)